jgi:hypothetical protein
VAAELFAVFQLKYVSATILRGSLPICTDGDFTCSMFSFRLSINCARKAKAFTGSSVPGRLAVLFSAGIAPAKPDEGRVRFPMQSAGEWRFLVLHRCCISHGSEIQSKPRPRLQRSNANPDNNELVCQVHRMSAEQFSCVVRRVPKTNVIDFCYRLAFWEGIADRKLLILKWLPPRDSNPDRLLQRQLSYH